MASGFNVWHRRLPPLHKVSFQIRILLLRNLCKALVYGLLLAAAALALGEGGMAPSAHPFHLSDSLSVLWLWGDSCSFFGPLSLVCSVPPFLGLYCFPIPSWFPIEQR